MSSDNLAKIIDQLTAAKKEAEEFDGKTVDLKYEFSLPKIQAKITKATSSADIARVVQQVNDLALQYIRDELKAALDAAMNSNIWGDGEDIIDTGELMNSLEVTISGNKITMDYSADYAAFVHYGGYIAPYGNKSIEKVYIPGRPWVDAVVQGDSGIQPIDFVALYARAWENVVG